MYPRGDLRYLISLPIPVTNCATTIMSDLRKKASSRFICNRFLVVFSVNFAMITILTRQHNKLIVLSISIRYILVILSANLSSISIILSSATDVEEE